jgi:hypothetical protein
MSSFGGIQAGQQLEYERNRAYRVGFAMTNKCRICGELKAKRVHQKCSKILQQMHKRGEI